MSIWFLAFLAGAAVAVCVPAGLRARRNSPYSATQLFKKRMNMMAPRSRGGRWVIVPDNHDVAMERLAIRRSRRRRRRILALLTLAAIGTGMWAWFERGAAVEIHLVVDGGLIFYLALMSEMKKRRAERDAKVRSLTSRRRVPEFVPTAQAGGRR